MLTELTGLYEDAYRFFAIFQDRPYAFLLESGMDPEKLGRYSFIGSEPFLTIKSKNEDITISRYQSNEIYQDEQFKGNPFDHLQELIRNYHRDYRSDIPFTGGAVGYLSYDLGHHLEKLNRTVIDDMNVPDLFFGFYDGIIIIDHLEEKTYLAAHGINQDAEAIIGQLELEIRNGLKNVETRLIGALPQQEKETDFRSNFTKEAYIKALEAIHEYIRIGEIYQANLTQRFETDLNVDPKVLYQILRRINPAPFASYMDCGEEKIVSSSPERFLRMIDGEIETRPIKGTVPRGKTPEEDAENRARLENSEKDKSELLMIVDLERNDLGRVSKTGSVEVTELFALETYPTVYHLVSTIKSQLKEGLDAVDLIRASFPGGSITGAPKIRAMDIIDELEPTARNIYTGSIGYIGYNGDIDLNIVIRTFVCKNHKAYFQAGGGIVWDSNNEMEYEETYHKAAALMRSIRIANQMEEEDADLG